MGVTNINISIGMDIPKKYPEDMTPQETDA